MAKIRSLRLQLTIVIVAITVVLTLIMGMMNIRSINIYSTEVANTGLNWQTQKTAGSLNRMLIKTQDAVDFIAGTVQQDFTTISQVQDPDFREDRKERIRRRFEAAADTIPIIDGFYIHFNEDLIQASDGFWYKRKNDQPVFEEQPFSHPRKSSNPMLEEMYRWYYGPLESLSPQWIPPYRNREGGPLLISYVKPVFVNRRCVALVGIDIRMDTLISMIRDTRIYESGYAVLFSNEGELYYHPDYPEGAPTTLKDFGLEPYAEVLKGRDSNDQLLSYHYKGQEKELAFITLRNSMNLGIIAPDEEIYEERRISYGRNLFLMVFFGLITSGMAIAGANRIIQPLKEIDEAARRMGQGNYDTLLHSTQKDEVGDLARNMDQTMLRMKEMVDRLEHQALEDNLTQVKNTRAYQLKVQELDRLIRKDPAKVPSFGVLMVDVNDLKGVNDRYGHARGNDLLLRTVKYICDLFKHSPVYRVGGDEFVVILQKEDYHNREAILSQLKPWNRKRNYEDDRPWDQLAFASGFSAYDPENDINFLHVFLRADAVMYENKKKAEGNRMR